MTAVSREFDQLRAFLKDMFQFNDHDLDFGIFKIIRLKKQFIETFIDGDDSESLRSAVTSALSGVQNTQAETAKNWLQAFSAKFGDMGRGLWAKVLEQPQDEGAQVQFRNLIAMPALADEEREQASAHLSTFLSSLQTSTEQLEVRVYNHLLNFFELYYQNGDFGYNTRAASAFKVPYETDYDGSDTLFHWKHKDSYYIKTGNGFNSIRCEIGGKWLEFRLAQGGDEEAETSERNNNKDSGLKHYRLAEIAAEEETDAEGKTITVWKVSFSLAGASTSKTEIYPRIWEAVFADGAELTPYMYKKPGKGDPAPGKPLFNNLEGDYDKTDGGQVKGIGQLRLAFDKYVDELAKREEFKGLGSNAPSRVEALKTDGIANMLWQLDRNLNKFYVGNDADYFIHKDLKGFLTREKNRFIKQVVFSDLDALLHAGEDNTTTLIARAFNIVADRLIDFLAAIEEFQKGLFELKKKVVDTHYLISVGKIPAHFHARVVANTAQLAEWKDVFKVEVGKAENLSEHPTLVVDTSLYAESDPGFQDDLLSLPEFNDLDEQTDGLLINSENWQALNLIEERFRGEVSGGFIDPPYNTGSDEFLYKDSFRHSSWISMFDNILERLSGLMDDESILWCSIDEHEVRSVSSVGSFFSKYEDQNIVIWQHSIQGKGYEGGTSLNHNYLVPFVIGKKGRLSVIGRSEEHNANYSNPDNDPNGDWRSGDVRNPLDRPNLKYNLPTPSGKEIAPPENGWRWKWETMQQKIASGEVVFNKDETWIQKKIYLKDQLGRVPESLLLGKDVGTTRVASNRLKQLFGVKNFSTPKPVGLVKHLIELCVNRNVYLDCFAGSGTTGEAVLEVNKIADEKIKFVLIETAKYFSTTLLERIKRVMFSADWKDGFPESDNGSVVVIKVQAFEQYEDLLDNLIVSWDQQALPQNVPVKYLFRPEQNALTASLDVSRPFSQTIRVGKKREVKAIDLMESWLYLQGYWVKSRRMYREFNRPYLAVETTQGTLIVFRDIADGEDDSPALNAILAKYADADGVSRIQRLELNHDGDLRRLDIETVLIRAEDFMRGTEWN